jgi:hypothetical protein
MIAAFLAWLFGTLYGLELTDEHERELIDHGAGIDRSRETGQRIGHGCSSWQAVAVLGIYQARWLIVFCVLFWRLAP